VTGPSLLSRRTLLTGLWLIGSSAAAVAQTRKGGDHGLGGTGIRGGDDQGLGGTGIVGVIQRFGSIVVNGERVSYAPDVPVRIDGEAASAQALQIGQVARVRAQRQANGTLTTRAIEIVSEVTGPIEQIKAGELTVLGQRIIWPGQENWRRTGAQVAVFGLRRTDGVVVASLIEPRHSSATRVTGVLERFHGDLQIGGLGISDVDPALVGRRIQAEGRVTQGVMHVTHARADNLSDLAGVRRLLIEGYVRRVGTDLQFGAGYVVRDSSLFQPAGGEARVVVDAIPDGSGGLRAESIHSVGHFPGSSLQGGNGPRGAPGTTAPQGTQPNGPAGPGAPPGSGGPNRPGGPSGQNPTGTAPESPFGGGPGPMPGGMGPGPGGFGGGPRR